MSVDSISPKSFLVDEDCAKVEDVGFVDEEEEKSKHEHTAEEKAISQKKYEKYEVSNKNFFYATWIDNQFLSVLFDYRQHVLSEISGIRGLMFLAKALRQI